MAEVTNLHRPLSTTTAAAAESESEPKPFYNQPNPFTFEFDLFSPPTSNPSFFTDYSSPFDLGFDLNSPPHTTPSDYDDADPNCFFFGADDDEIDDDDDDEHLNFVTDLFEPRRSHLTDDLIWDLDPGRVDDEPNHLFGFGPGLRVVGMDSQSDSSDVNLGFDNNNNNDVDDDDDDDDDGDNFVSFGVGNIERDEFEWEEVSERDNLNLLINGIEEISVSSDISTSEGDRSSLGDDEGTEEDERNLEWEVLLAVNNLESTFEFEYSEGTGNVMNEVSRVNLPEDYILTMEYDALFGQLAENEHALKGSPPAAKLVVENLPSVVLTKGEIGENGGDGVVCAVCKDEFVVGEKGTKLPCGHLYHGECILPWLGIRNTCPVCRHELPTDDAGYERRRRSERVGGSGNNGGGLVDGFEVRYHFELLP